MTQPDPAFLRGIVPSMNTPFLDDGSVDLAGIRRSVDAVVQAGVAGMLILAVAAETASRRGFRWGDVWEWTASTFRPYPGFVPGPDAAYSQAWFGRAKVLRGGSTATRTRLKSPRFRRFAEPAEDQLFCGFRSCAL